MGSTPHATNTWPLMLGGVVLGAVTGLVMAAVMASRSAPFPDFTVIGVALIGGTVGAAVGLLLAGLAGLVMRLLESQSRGVAAAAVGVVVGSVTLAVLLQLGHTQEATQEAFPTAGALGLIAAAGAWWSRSRSRGHAERP